MVDKPVARWIKTLLKIVIVMDISKIRANKDPYLVVSKQRLGRE